MNTKQNIYSLVLFVLLGLLTNCKESSEKQNDQSSEKEIMDNEEAIAIINQASGSNISGKATFTQVSKDSVKINLSISNATTGSHAVHLHENGDCSATDATSAGGHWNPTNTDHGQRGGEYFHKGDITNMTVDDNGNGTLEMTVSGWTIGGAEESNILNKAVIIHAGADDFKSQPSGAAGQRVACGLIEEKAK